MPTCCGTKLTSLEGTSTGAPSSQLATCSRTTSFQFPVTPTFGAQRLPGLAHDAALAVHVESSETYGCYKFDNGNLVFAPCDLSAHFPVFLHLRVTNLPVPHAAPKPRKRATGKQGVRFRKRSAVYSKCLFHAAPGQYCFGRKSNRTTAANWYGISTTPRPIGSMPSNTASVCPHCLRPAGPLVLPVLLIHSNSDLRDVSGAHGCLEGSGPRALNVAVGTFGSFPCQ